MSLFKGLVNLAKSTSRRLRDGGEYDANGKKHGVWLEHYANGQIHTFEEFRHGGEVGRHTWYYDDGELLKEIIYSDEHERLSSRCYHQNGSLHWEETYQCWKKGPTEFTYKIYHSGRLAEEGRMFNHMLNGELRVYDSNGELVERSGMYVDGDKVAELS